MTHSTDKFSVTVCQHRSCVRNGSPAVLAAFQSHQSEHLAVSSCECQGQCGSGPTVRIAPDNTWYCQVTPADVEVIVSQHCCPHGTPVESLLNPRIHPTAATYAHLAAQYQAFIQASDESE